MTQTLQDWHKEQVAEALQTANTAENEFSLALQIFKIDRWETEKVKWPPSVWKTYKAKVAADNNFHEVYRASLK